MRYRSQFLKFEANALSVTILQSHAATTLSPCHNVEDLRQLIAKAMLKIRGKLRQLIAKGWRR
jgi:hypothetical protein